MVHVVNKRGRFSSYEVGEASRVSVPRSLFRRGASVRNHRLPVNESPDRDLPFYRDCGNCDRICTHCHASFWYDERVRRLSRVNTAVYTQCCKLGSVALPYPFQPPQQLVDLYQDRQFLDNIRAYNAMFSMTSFGATIDETVNFGRGPYTFKISGQISHWIGSLCPAVGEHPRFLQLYMYDTDNEVSNRLRFFDQQSQSALSEDVVHLLTELFSRFNGYVKTFKTAREMAAEMNLDDYSVRLYDNIPDRRYGPPAPGSLGAIVCSNDPNATEYDIIVHSKSGPPERVSKLHYSYMPLQYPLLFPFGEEGWSSHMRLRENDGTRRKALTVNMYYSYQLHDRPGFYRLLLHAGRLFQQYLVDAYVCVEQSRLDYVRLHQDNLRSEFVSGIYDAISRGDSQGKFIGKRIFLPSSFVGSPRYMYKHYQDALAICRVHGNPQYFITFTCNVNWPEIARYNNMNGIHRAQDRPDIIARIFQIKVQEFISFIKEDKTFGDVAAYLYTIEFQKRGLPHCHTLLWVTRACKITSAADVDKFITAEFPDPILEPTLYGVISKLMIHGPCGMLNPLSPCMMNGVCSKSFPKPFNRVTTFDKEGYARYKRHDDINHKLPNGIEVHSGFVVPYNKRLCSRFNAHINVEYCGWNMMIKYLFKYISKGVDRVAFAIRKADSDTSVSAGEVTEPANEIKEFVNGRYICPHEAAWRIFNFPIHERHPAVQILAVHLPNMQSTTFDDNSRLQMLIRNPAFGRSTLTGWFLSNHTDAAGRHLTYCEYPSLFRWDISSKEWIRRSRSTVPSIGRLVYVHPTSGEVFYLRMLLCHQKGCRSYAEVRSVGGTAYATFQLACEALGLIGDDKEWLSAFQDASVWASARELRMLFCHLLLFCDVTDPIQLWEEAWRKMADDFLHSLRSASGSASCVVDDNLLQQQLRFEIERILNSCTPSKSLADFRLPLPSSSSCAILRNRLLFEETSYDRSQLQHQHDQMQSRLNPDQLAVYNTIRSAVSTETQCLLFVYGHGGTGKTFLWSTILAYFRSIGKIVLAVAGSGIASLLLPSGRTAHSRFNIPLNLTATAMCNIKKRTQLADLLGQTTAIIWDEATMTDKQCFECVDRTFRDILNKKDTPFGGMSMLLGGDFRQTLPVKPKGTAIDIISSTLPNSYIWPHFSIYMLQHNMRLSDPSDTTGAFAAWLLKVGNGLVGEPDHDLPHYITNIQIPDSLLISHSEPALQSLIDFVYSSDILANPTANNLSSRGIVCPKNETAEKINQHVLALTAAPSKIYYSSDSITPHTHRISDSSLLYPQEYLNQLNFSGFPFHKLLLKIKTPIILLRNINQRLGLCNGTRLIVTQLLPTVIEATIITGTSIGNRVYIPRIKFVHNSPDLPFVFTRKQFPVRVCYAMTINKSQGQSLERVGIYLPQPVFAHGQLYVALSRATSPNSVRMLIIDEAGKPSNMTKNVVYKDLLRKVNSLEVVCIAYFCQTGYKSIVLLRFVTRQNLSINFAPYKTDQMERISNLGYGSPGSPIEVRILRKWTPHFRRSETWYLAVDEHGDTIQMLAEKSDQAYIETKIFISHCYQIENYTCSETNEYQRFIKNPIHINIGPACPIEEIDDSDKIPRFSFGFCTMDHLHIIKDKNEEFPDLIGILNKLKDRNKTNGESFIILSLTDGNNQTMDISLWNDCISIPDKFDRHSLTDVPSDTVVAVTNIKPSTYRGNLTINSTDATHVYVNPPVPEKDALLHRSKTNLGSSTTALTTPITLTELTTKSKQDVVGKTFLSKAHITGYTIKGSWYNAICAVCNRNIAQQGDGWFCTTDGKVPSPRFMYNISGTISDNRSTMSVLFPDETLTKIAGKPCRTFIQNEGVKNRKVLPPVLEQQRFQDYNFHLELARKSPPDRILFAAVDISPITILPEEPTTITPIPETPSTDLSQDSMIDRSESTSKQKTTTKRQLTYDSADDISHLNPSKRERFEDA